MKTSNPYDANYDVKMTPETVSGQLSKAGGKAKARYPDPPIRKDQKNASAGKGGGRAFTPGGPAGS